MAELLVSLIIGFPADDGVIGIVLHLIELPDDDGVDGIVSKLIGDLAWPPFHGSQLVGTRFLQPLGHSWHVFAQVSALSHRLEFCHCLVRWPRLFQFR